MNQESLEEQCKQLTQQLKLCQEQNQIYKDVFIMAKDEIILTQEEEHKQVIRDSLGKTLKAKDVTAWIKDYSNLSQTMLEIEKVLEKFIPDFLEISTTETLNLQKYISENIIAKQEWDNEDKEKLKYSIFLLSLIYGSFQTDF